MTINPTQDDVRARFIYVKEVGKLVWLRRPKSDFSDENKWAVWNTRYSGNFAGRIGARGYRVIQCFGKVRRASRLIWVYHYGYWPEVIDHIDGDIANDDIGNLRDVTQEINSQNRALGSANTTGFYGVYRDGSSVRAQINVAGRRIYLGTFPSIEEAASARKAAEQRFGFHPNHGRALPRNRGE